MHDIVRTNQNFNQIHLFDERKLVSKDVAKRKRLIGLFKKLLDATKILLHLFTHVLYTC